MSRFIQFLFLSAFQLFSFSAFTAQASSLEQLQASFMKRYDEANAERDQNLKKLEASYLGALQRHIDKVKASGKLERVIPIRDEIEAIEIGADPLTKLPKNVDSNLKRMRQQYLEARAKVGKSHAETLVRLSDTMDQGLKKEEADLTRAGKIDEALAAQRMRETLAVDAGIKAARERLGAGEQRGGLRLGEWMPLLEQDLKIRDSGRYPVGKLSKIDAGEREFWSRYFGGRDEAALSKILVSPSPCRMEFRCSQSVSKLKGKVALAVPNGEATVRINVGGEKLFEKRLFADARSEVFSFEFPADKTIEFQVDDNNHPGNDWIYWTDLEVR